MDFRELTIELGDCSDNRYAADEAASRVSVSFTVMRENEKIRGTIALVSHHPLILSAFMQFS